MGYDAVNRWISTTNPLGDVASQVYDAAGRRIASIDPLGNVSSQVFDAAVA